MALRMLSFAGRRALFGVNTVTLTRTNPVKIISIELLKPAIRQNAKMAIGENELPSKFTLKAMKKHFSVIPLVTAIGSVVFIILGFWVYFWNTRTDLSIYKNSPRRKLLQDTMDLHNPPNLKIFDMYKGEDRSFPELAKLLQEINEGEEAMKKK